MMYSAWSGFRSTPTLNRNPSLHLKASLLPIGLPAENLSSRIFLPSIVPMVPKFSIVSTSTSSPANVSVLLVALGAERAR